jgi:hypothetical protein
VHRILAQHGAVLQAKLFEHGQRPQSVHLIPRRDLGRAQVKIMQASERCIHALPAKVGDGPDGALGQREQLEIWQL